MLKFFKIPSGIQTHDLHDLSPSTHCATLLDNNFGKGTTYKIILDFIILINNTPQHVGVPYHLDYICNC